jgi:hypothetical protein
MRHHSHLFDAGNFALMVKNAQLAADEALLKFTGGILKI